MNSFLHSNPLPWLLESGSPAVRYRTLRDIVSNQSDDEYSRIFDDPLVSSIPGIDKMSVLGDVRRLDMTRRGTMWFFCVAAECGLNRRTAAVEKTGSFLLDRACATDGGFTLSWNPPLSISCRTGDMVHALVKTGFSDNRVAMAINWILTHQRHDGGWLHCPEETLADSMKLILFNRSGGGLRRENDPETPSCVHATGSCLRALLDWPHPDDRVRQAVKKAAEFLLAGELFVNTSKYHSLTYPAFFRYDILQGLILVARSGCIGDTRTVPSFNLVMGKQNQDGTWNMESSRHAMGRGPGWAEGRSSSWVTLQALSLLKYMEN